MKAKLVFAVSLLVLALCQAVTLPGEIAYYPLHDGEGELVKEAQGRLPDGKVSGSFWHERDGAPVLDFGGMKISRQARVVLPQINFDGPFSIAIWVSAYWWKENWGAICFRSDATYGIRNNRNHPGQIHFVVRDKKAQRGAHLYSDTVLDTNHWHHIVATFEPGKAMRLFIDGKLDAERTVNVPVNLNTEEKSSFQLGRSGKENCYTGVMGDLHLYDRALTPEDVSTLWQSENRFAMGKSADNPFPKEGRVSATLGNAEILEGGALRVRSGDTTFSLNSSYSYPSDPSMGFNMLAPSAGKGCEDGWKSSVVRGKDSVTVTAAGRFYRVTRTVRVAERGLVRVEETITNLTDKDQAVVFSHHLGGDVPVVSWYLCGEENSGSPSDGRIPPSNPTGWFSTGKDAIAWVVEDDIFRCHLDASVKRSEKSFTSQFGSRRIGMPAGKSHTFAFTLYPVTGDFFDFLNQLRKDWKIPVQTLPGPFISVRTAAQRCEVYKGLAADPAKMKAYFTRRNARTFTLNPWFNYWDGCVFVSRDEYREHMQTVMKTLRASVPDAKFLASIETYCYFLGENDFTTPAAADFQWDKVTRGTVQRVMESPWKDSATMTHTGKVALYPESPVQGARRKYLRLMVHPVVGNHLYKTRLDEFAYLLDVVGLDGIYQDMFGYSSPTSIIHDRWDGFSVSVKPNGTIASRYTHLAPYTAPARTDFLRLILSRKKIALTNFGAPTTRAMQTIPYLNFCEAAGSGVGRQNLDSIPPDSSGCAMNQLSTPLGYGPHRSEEVNAVQLMKRVRAYLRYGCLYIHTSVRNSFPEDGPTGGSYDFINHCYPITPLELHKGWVKGRERIVSCVSFETTWDRTEKPKALRFDAVGRTINVGDAVSVTGKAGAWKIRVVLDDWKESVVLE